jgi:hypothetical protein
MAQMLTANRLRDGAVLYRRGESWVETLAEGDVFAAQTDADAALAKAQVSVAGNEVVSPYLFDVHADKSPVKEREIIRAMGPSVREDLGKQADSPTSPLWGGRKTLSGTKSFSGGGKVDAKSPHPKNAPHFSTSPQGGGEQEPDVSI